MRLLLARALRHALPRHPAPAAARDNPARDARRGFRVGSVTKTFVAAVVLQLVAERRLSLDDPVPEAGGAPLRMLLDHTSGIYNHSDDPRVFEHGLLTQWQPQ